MNKINKLSQSEGNLALVGEDYEGLQGFDYAADQWRIIFPATDDSGNHITEIFDFANDQRFNGLTPEAIQVVKAGIYGNYNILEVEHGLEYNGAQATLKGVATQHVQVLRALQLRYPTRSLHDLDQLQLLELAALNADGELFAKATVQLRIAALRALYDLSLTGSNRVGAHHLPKFDLPNDWVDLAVKEFASKGFDQATWMRGGSFNTVPFEVSLALTAYCQEVLYSDKTKYLLAMCALQRKIYTKDLDVKIGRGAWSTVWQHFGKGTTPAHNAVSAKRLISAYFECLQVYYPDAKTVEDLPIQRIPFDRGDKTSNSFGGELRNLITTCYVAVLLLSGVRESDLHRLKPTAFDVQEDYVDFSSLTVKLGGDPKTLRLGTFLIPRVVEVMNEVGLHALEDEARKTFFEYSVLTFTHNTYTQQPLNNGGTSKDWLDKFYSRFLESDGKHFKPYCPSVTEHAFRHTFVEFAMRRFDGNTLPLIRDWLRHSGRQVTQWTHKYYDHKIEISEYQALGKKWLIDIVESYVTGSEDIYGQLGAFIKSKLNDAEFIPFSNPKERKENYEKVFGETQYDRLLKYEEIFGEDFENRWIDPSPTRTCSLNMAQQEKAACYDKHSRTAMVGHAGAEVCAGCPNNICTSRQLEHMKVDLATLKKERDAFVVAAAGDHIRSQLASGEEAAKGFERRAALLKVQADKRINAIETFIEKQEA